MSSFTKGCPECGNKFHACGSCGLPYLFLQEYCSEDCYRKSLKYMEQMNKTKRHLNQIFSNPYNIEYFDDVSDTNFFLNEEEIQEFWEDLKVFDYQIRKRKDKEYNEKI